METCVNEGAERAAKTVTSVTSDTRRKHGPAPAKCQRRVRNGVTLTSTVGSPVAMRQTEQWTFLTKLNNVRMNAGRLQLKRIIPWSTCTLGTYLRGFT